MSLKSLNRAECLRYLGNSRVPMNGGMDELLDSCEKELLGRISEKYLRKKINVEDSPLITGSDIRAHLAGCREAIVLCVTLGAEVDRLIRTAQVVDMARAVVLDAMASVAAEAVCDEAELRIAAENPGKYLTSRFSPGYGDYPIELQGDFLSLLDAPRKIGLCVNSGSMLTPSKSVTAVIGLSDVPVPHVRLSCTSCNMKKSCRFRKAGTRCEF